MGLFGKSKEQKLRDAAKSGDVAAVRAALDSGADVNDKEWVRAPRRRARSAAAVPAA
jgi:hypothetical protein